MSECVIFLFVLSAGIHGTHLEHTAIFPKHRQVKLSFNIVPVVSNAVQYHDKSMTVIVYTHMKSKLVDKKLTLFVRHSSRFRKCRHCSCVHPG